MYPTQKHIEYELIRTASAFRPSVPSTRLRIRLLSRHRAKPKPGLWMCVVRASQECQLKTGAYQYVPKTAYMGFVSNQMSAVAKQATQAQAVI